MAQSPLRLRQYFFTKVCCEADLKYKASHPNAEYKFDVTVQSNIGPHKNNQRDWRVLLDIHVISSEKTVPYRLDLQVIGFFDVLPDYPEEKMRKLIRITGASILYSAARDFVLGITSRGPFAPLLLPTMSFIEPEEAVEAREKKPKRSKSSSLNKKQNE